tara:strand:- start:7996 stop:8787 length:792 start_codon:yes stop_codon:yes gene_type:complete
MNSILKKIWSYKKEEVDYKKTLLTLDSLMQIISDTSIEKRDFYKAIYNKNKNSEIALICEIKKASPSRGIIKENFDVTKIASDYTAGGATCISVLTDYPSFKGSDSDLSEARLASALPLLRKDFYLDIYQVYETKYLGGDCILIIMAMLDDEMARNLYETANLIGLDSIFEVHNEQEYDRALNLNAKIIGINNRNLHTFETDITNTINLSSKFSKDHIIISESGIFNKKEINMLNKCGVNAYLIGESIIKNSNIIDSTKKLIE